MAAEGRFRAAARPPGPCDAGRLSRRALLRGGVGLGGAALLGALPGCREVDPLPPDPGWWPGEVAHLLGAAGAREALFKVSFRTPPRAPVLRVRGREGSAAPGQASDGGGRFHRFRLGGLEPDTAYELELVGAGGEPLCDPWTFRTFPAPDARPRRFRLLVYTCAGGSDLFVHPTRGFLFRPTGVRQRILRRGLSLAPDAVLAIGDHVYFDLRSRPGLAMGRSPQALLTAGRFRRDEPVLGGHNEQVLIRAFGPQIADLYATHFRSVPVFFVQDDHDFTENDEADARLRTFPPDRFMREVAAATRRLFYPEFPPTGLEPRAVLDGEGLAGPFAVLRVGRLFEALVADCRGHLTNARDPARRDRGSAFLPPGVEGWVIRRLQKSDALHGALVPSTPVLWTAGKWGEWYPDVQDPNGVLRADLDKPFWPRGWLEQHDRLLAAASARRDRMPLVVSGDLHATGAGRILRSGERDLRPNPVVSLLSGTPGSAGPMWPSAARGQRPVPSGVLDAEEWVPPVEENGFTLLEFTPEGLRAELYRWRPEQGLAALDTLEPFAVLELPRGRPAGPV